MSFGGSDYREEYKEQEFKQSHSVEELQELEAPDSIPVQLVTIGSILSIMTVIVSVLYAGIYFLTNKEGTKLWVRNCYLKPKFYVAVGLYLIIATIGWQVMKFYLLESDSSIIPASMGFGIVLLPIIGWFLVTKVISIPQVCVNSMYAIHCITSFAVGVLGQGRRINRMKESESLED